MGHHKKQSDRMLTEIKHTVEKYTGTPTDTKVGLERSESTGTMQITVQIKGVLYMKIEFNYLDPVHHSS